MGRLDTLRAFASATTPAVSNRKRKPGRRPIASSDECAGQALHFALSAPVLWLLRFQFRARVLLLLVREILRTAACRRLGPSTIRSPQPLAGNLWRGLGAVFKLRSMVVLLAGRITGNARELVRLPRLRLQIF